jgi:hypothetical protein
MPTRYTLEQVISIFESNKCSLLDTEYTNQLEQLNYIATCGHKNSVSLKMFLRCNGLKCKQCALGIPTFQTIAKTFSDKGCVLNMTEEEFNIIYNNNNNKSKINYIASCGHNNSVCWKNFTSLNQGINCPLCVNKNTIQILKELSSGEKKNRLIEQEYKCIQYFTIVINQTFQVKKTFDGCKADIVIKPIDIIEDLWLGIQVKSTYKKSDREQYHFRLNGTNYDNYIILCICLEDKKMWLIPYEEVKGQKTIKISAKSKYNNFEVSTDNVYNKLTNFYEITPKFQFDTINIPTSNTQKQEQQYRKLREDKLNFIEFTYPGFEGTVYDFKIFYKKFQEKVGFICRDNPNSFGFSINKSDGKKSNCSYKIGDNDFYWLHCKNTSRFYVIPESLLIEKGFIGDKCKQHLYISPTNINTKWTDEYLFDYDDVDKERLLELLQI